MIAEIYPLRRMPRGIGVLDYRIPDDMHAARGMFVAVPLRKQMVWGIVRRVKDAPPRGIRVRSITDVAKQEGLREAELSFFEELARSLAVSVSTLLYTSLPVPPSRENTQVPAPAVGTPLMIPKSEAATVARLSAQLSSCRTAFAQAPDLKRMAAVIAGYAVLNPEKKLCVVCPHVRDVRLLARLLGNLSPLCVTGDESNRERYALWQNYRQRPQGVLITTRAGALYADAQTASIFLVRSGHPDHAQHDRNPRLDAREALRLFADHMTTGFYFLDVFPRPEDLLLFGEEQVLAYPTGSYPVLIDQLKEQPASGHAILCASTVEAIAQALERQERVLLVYNKKGYARRLVCKDCAAQVMCRACGHPVRVHRHTTECILCGETAPIALTCPSCRGTKIDQRGFGIERIADALSQMFPDTPCAFIDAEHQEDRGNRIVLATRWYLENAFDPSAPARFGCVVHLDPDTPLYSTDVRASACALWSLAEWQGAAHAMRAPLSIQTQEPQWFARHLAEPMVFLREELARRKTYGQPPYERWLTVELREAEPHKKEMEMYRLKDALERLTDISVTVEGEQLIVRCAGRAFEEALPLFATLDDRFIIDMHAFVG